MTNNEIKIAELQDAINARLEKFDGAPYEGTGYHSWYCGEIKTECASRGLDEEILATAWEITFNAMEKGISVSMERIAKVKCDLKRDKRYKWGAGRGKCNSIRVEFEPEYLNMTYGEMRTALFYKERDKRIEYAIQQHTEYTEKARAALEELHRLNNLTF